MALEIRPPQAFGPRRLGKVGYRFRLWAPSRPQIRLLVDEDDYEMERRDDGWFERDVTKARPGSRYAFAFDEFVVPDPASHFQPDGVHGRSEVVDATAYQWNDAGWNGCPWEETVVYEAHVGTFTPEGTFRSAIERLDHVRAFGATAIEWMPVAQAPGARGWGYDGVALFAPANAYGRPDDLRALVDAAHARGLSVFLDVVYNHLGPEGNYLHVYAPEFFTQRYHTPWGSAMDLDGPHSENVRAFFIENALYWLDEFHFDGLRFDAVHALNDRSTEHFLDELCRRVRAAIPRERHVHLVLENDDNEAHFLDGGAGERFDAQWNDDAHHALHVALTGERARYYRDYPRAVWALGRALAEGFAYQGERSEHRGGVPRGDTSTHLPPTAFVDFLQNHDQVGNRAFGERLTSLVSWNMVRTAAAIYLMAPAVPLLFMGEEWGSRAPFLFFSDFTGELAAAVTNGRRNEFAGDPQFDDPSLRARIPDPNALETFERSKLDWDSLAQGRHATMLEFYTAALRARTQHVVPLLRRLGARPVPARFELLAERVLRVIWEFPEALLALYANLGDAALRIGAIPAAATIVFGAETTEAVLRGGTLAPWSAVWTIERRTR